MASQELDHIRSRLQRLVVVAVAVHFSLIQWVEMNWSGEPDFLFFRARVGEISMPVSPNRFEKKRNEERVPIYLLGGLAVPAATIGAAVYILAGKKKL